MPLFALPFWTQPVERDSLDSLRGWSPAQIAPLARARSAEAGEVGMSRGVWVYVLLQVPGGLLAALLLWLAVHLGWLSAGWALGLWLGWVLKDCALYPMVRDAFRSTDGRSEPLIGRRGVVAESLAPQGLVRLGGEIWRAEPLAPGESIVAGCAVVVRAVHGLTLLVEAEGGAPPPHQEA